MSEWIIWVIVIASIYLLFGVKWLVSRTRLYRRLDYSSPLRCGYLRFLRSQARCSLGFVKVEGRWRFG